MTTLAAPPLARRLGCAAWVGAAALLALPAVATLFTREVNWTAFDFAVFAAMLALIVVPFQFALRRVRNFAALAATAVALGTGFVMVWANLAVGLIGDGPTLANRALMAVLAVPAIGAILVRGRPGGMARVMLATALVEAVLLGIFAVLSPERGVLFSAVFVAGWLLSAWLFRLSAAMPDWHTAAD